MSSCTVVDENDQVIGYKNRDEIKPEDIYRIAALWVTNSKGDVLLAQRALSKKNSPGKWGPAVAGTVEEGETYETNIVKEAKEELDLTITLPTFDIKEFWSGERRHFTQWFTLVLDKPIEYFKPDPREVAAVKWFTRDELIRALAERKDDFLYRMPKILEFFQK